MFATVWQNEFNCNSSNKIYEYSSFKNYINDNLMSNCEVLNDLSWNLSKYTKDLILNQIITDNHYRPVKITI